uniref:Xylulose kinase-1 n=1 Tax=Tanacetum cinerariifolium TaxID=118510 RepID=A0A699GUX5_TANCI|nr:hypothetical protein [Tanacetum cinerariifolium]
MSTIKFAETHNLVAFLEKPAESKGFEQIIDLLNATPIRYTLTINPTIYTSCIQQFWDSAKVKTVNEDVWIRALIDGKKIIIIEASIRRDLHFQDAEGTAYLPNDTIFEELARIGFVQVFVNHQLGDMSHHKKIFVTPSLTKKVFANMKREGKGFSRLITPLFETMIVQAPEEVGEGSEVPSNTHHTPIIIQPSSFQPHKKQTSRRKQRKETKVPLTKPQTEERVPTTSNDPLPSGEDRMQLTELMNLCTNLQKQVLDLEKTKTAQAKKIADLKKRVKKLERTKKLRTFGLKRLWKIGSTARVESSKDKESLGGQEDASKQGRMIDNIDQDEEIALVNETQGRMNDEEMFEVNDLAGDEVIVDATAGEVVTTAKDVEVTTATTTPQISKDELTLAQTLIEIKIAKPKERGKDQIAFNEEVTRNIEAEIKAKMEEEERIAREKDEANMDVIEQWDEVQAKTVADMELAQKLQTKEQEQLTDAEKARLFMELLEKRRKFFAREREKFKRGTEHPLKLNKEILSIKRVNTFVDMNTEIVKERSKNTQAEKLDEHAEAEVDNDQKEAEMKMYMKIIPDDEIAIDAIPLATKHPIIVD